MQTKRLTPWPALPRSTWDYTYAYRVVTSKPDGSIDQTIVLSGDTSLYDGMEEVYAGADILLHEAYSYDPKTNPYDAKAPITVSYMNAFHTSTEQLAGVLKKLALSQMNSRQ